MKFIFTILFTQSLNLRLIKIAGLFASGAYARRCKLEYILMDDWHEAARMKRLGFTAMLGHLGDDKPRICFSCACHHSIHQFHPSLHVIIASGNRRHVCEDSGRGLGAARARHKLHHAKAVCRLSLGSMGQENRTINTAWQRHGGLHSRANSLAHGVQAIHGHGLIRQCAPART